MLRCRMQGVSAALRATLRPRPLGVPVRPYTQFTRHVNQFQIPRALGAGRMASSAAMIAVRRFLLLPVVAATAAGTALNQIKSSIPDFPMLEVPDEVKGVLFGIGSFLKSEADAMRAVFAQGKPHPAPGSSSLKGSGGEGGTSGPAGAAAAGAAAAAAAAPDPAAEEKKAAEAAAQKKLVDDLIAKIAELEAALNQEKEQLESAAHQNAEQKATLEQLQEENQSLRRAMVLSDMQTSKPAVAKRPIDIFSEIMDLRARADNAFHTEDHLPRVVVVGDQSAGKTSVLEVLVRAHIFPRGAGEMMTRAPIQVTLSEGPRQVASFRGSNTTYDLTSASELAQLRKEIERRMVASIGTGEAVSNQTLALDVRGPGLNPMVLVDLPGIIQHHTQGMSSNTKGSILEMCKHHIENPNSIILCIQDAARDAEGSSVADLVHTADPTGQRTIFVLTKVDLAEQLKMAPGKLKQTLKGQRFNMRAKAYFAVVTGTANPNDTIDAIRANEKRYFDKSAFVKEGAISPRQSGIDNLSRAVSDAFWERVRATVAAETKDVQISLRRKENEWKNTYPGQPRASREDVFQVGRTRILENMAKHSASLTPVQCEQQLREELVSQTMRYFLFDVYQNSASTSDTYTGFKTNVQNVLDMWVGGELPQLSIEVARMAILKEFGQVLDIDDAEHTYSALAARIKTTTAESLKWNPASSQKLSSIQELMLSDDMIKSKRDWEEAVEFMSRTIAAAHNAALTRINEMVGPSFFTRWTQWRSTTPEQRTRQAVFTELSAYFQADKGLHPELSDKEMTALQQNLKQRHGLEVDAAIVEENFKIMYNMHFLARAQASADYCKSRFGQHPDANKAPNGLACADVALFWRYLNLAKATSNVLRLESMEYRRDLEMGIRQQLDEIGADQAAKQTLIAGKKVALAEEIEILRHIQAKLDAFVKAIRKEESA